MSKRKFSDEKINEILGNDPLTLLNCITVHLTDEGISVGYMKNELLIDELNIQEEMEDLYETLEPVLKDFTDKVAEKIVELMKEYAGDEKISSAIEFMNMITEEDEDEED